MKLSVIHAPALAALTMIAGLQAGQAAPVNVNAGVSTLSPCPSFCGGAGAASAGDTHGGAGDVTAQASLSNVDGSGAAQATLSDALGLPNLQAQAASNAASATTRSSSVGASATGLRQYLYSGQDTTIDLNIDLHGRATATNLNDARLQAQVMAYAGPDLDIFSTSHGTLKFEIIPFTPGLSLLDDTTVSVPVNSGLQTVHGNLSLALHDGESFFVWAQLSASGVRGGSANGFGTLTLAFSDTTGISPVSSVPLPGSVWLLGSVVGGVGFMRRRQG